jgi:hypothetical protein
VAFEAVHPHIARCWSPHAQQPVAERAALHGAWFFKAAATTCEQVVKAPDIDLQPCVARTSVLQISRKLNTRGDSPQGCALQLTSCLPSASCLTIMLFHAQGCPSSAPGGGVFCRTLLYIM